jgi:accessory gene regulator B
MAQSEIISVEDNELYEYGLHQSFILLANIFTTILVGWIFNMMIESIIFLLAFVPLRSYAGGYHAKRQRDRGTGTLSLGFDIHLGTP